MEQTSILVTDYPGVTSSHVTQVCFTQQEDEIFLDMFEDEYRQTKVRF